MTNKKTRRKRVRTISQILRTGEYVIVVGGKVTADRFQTADEAAEAKEALIKSGANNAS
jgi:hypothetical protein